MSNNFLNSMKKETDLTTTANGAKAFRTSKSYVLDYFAQGSALRNANHGMKIDLFTKSLGEDELLTMKALFYSRDVRGGQGERQTFKELIAYLAENHPELVKVNLELIAFFGRWDDLYALFGTKLEKDAIAIMKKQLDEDYGSENPSLLAKWMHSENASSKEGTALARKFMAETEMTPRKYRKTLSAIRAKIKLVETNLSSKEYDTIEYSKLPSKAGIKYRKAFLRNDEERYQAFLDAAVKGEVKVNASTLYPYEIIGKFINGHGDIINVSYEEIQLLQAAWDNLPDYIKGSMASILPMIDTSGSMTWTAEGMPIKCAIGLGMYCAERNNGPFKNHFLSFNSRPRLVEITGKNLKEKVVNICRTEWGGSTNIEAAFDLVLRTAQANNLKQEDLPERIAIISDMQFNGCVYGADGTTFEIIKKKYEDAGYTMPRLIFWNVNATSNNIPMQMNSAGVQLVSGASPSIFEALLEDEFLGAYELMLKVLNKERYDCVKA